MTKELTKEEFEDELYDILSMNIDEPAGHGCGYGVTAVGQAEITKLFERITMSTNQVAVIEEKLFEVTAVEKTQILFKGLNVVEKIGCKSHAHRKPVIAVSEKAARSKIERSITKEMGDVAAEALIDRLEVKVEAINFPG